MAMYSYDQVLTDVRQVYEQLTGLPAPRVDLKNPHFPLPRGVNPVSLVQSEIDYLNLYLINSGISMRLSKVPTWTPPAEIYEDQQEYVVRMELAGLSEDDITVHQINNILIVRGTRSFKRETEDAQYHTTERVYGTFERIFPLPNYVQPDNHQTNLADGIYEIRIPKIEAATGAGKEGSQRGGAQKSTAAHKSSQEAGQEKEKKR